MLAPLLALDHAAQQPAMIGSCMMITESSLANSLNTEHTHNLQNHCVSCCMKAGRPLALPEVTTISM